MADLRRFIRTTVSPALAALPGSMDSPEARVLLLAIGLQESKLEERVQRVNGGGIGPARGLWQFERGGGVHGVLTHPASREVAQEMSAIAGVPPVDRTVWSKLAIDDIFACRMARLLLFTDPKRLPALGRGAEAWDYYVRNWRPGKPHPHSWNGYYAQALEAVR